MFTLLSNDEILEEYPLKIRFSNEVAIDTGGVCRDMFSGFWEDAYSRFFDGSTLLTPALHANVDMSLLPQLGRILSHGFLACGYLPVRVAFPCLAGILVSPTIEIPSSVVVQAFSESLCSFEAAIIKEALSVEGQYFSSTLVEKLFGILSRYGCRVCPPPSQLKSQLYHIAKFEFQTKPLAALHGIGSGIPPKEKSFWASFSVGLLHSLYLALSATAEKVLTILDEPIAANPSEARVFEYLKQYIGNMNNAEARRFLRYTTGSSVLISQRISVTFNGLTGLARRPIGHTCGCILELPSTYLSYVEFEDEFKSILSDDEYAWEMQAI